MRIIFEVPDDDPVFARYFVRELLQGAALGCRPLFVGENRLPSLKNSGIVFREDPAHGSGDEYFTMPDVVYERGWGDCNDLVQYEVARRRALGRRDSVTVADFEGDGGMHAQIRTPDGTIEDPSIECGAIPGWPNDFLYDL